MRVSNRRKLQFARGLRGKATDAETKLWLALRDRRLDGFKFVRQTPIGPYTNGVEI
jgi:very-short-patch-repair endonuclease